jgi:hypothetical protein
MQSRKLFKTKKSVVKIYVESDAQITAVWIIVGFNEATLFSDLISLKKYTR